MRRFHRLYNLEEDKNATVASKCTGWWGDSFRRVPMGGVEEVQKGELERIMRGIYMSNNRDTWVWDLVSDGSFSVSSIRRCIDAVRECLQCGSR